MSWIRKGDEWNSAPEWMNAQELAAERGDDRLLNELKGAAEALYTYSAQQWTDYVVTFGAAVTFCGLTRVEPVTADLITIGVLTDVSTPEQRKYKLLERRNFVHLIKSDEKAKNNKRRSDRRRGSLMVPVLLRDGAQCRYCEDIVNFDDTRSGNGVEMDHRSFEEKTTPDNYVVSCRDCNQMRVDLGDRAEEELPLIPAPDEPIYNEQVLRKLSGWRRLTDTESRRLGIPNPLARGKVEAQTPTRQPAGGTDITTTTSHPSAPSPGPAESQSAADPQFPQDSRKVEPRGRAAMETQPHPATSPVNPESLPTTSSQALSDAHLERAPWGHQEAHVRDSGLANGESTTARRRRRRRR
ncbi:hypothetical protein [Corynebacterium flavescens]|uniref:hypothetical protein n=1 Tax=Corynebacterium flavescens TaxID=28028 RepID=UPI0028980D76|nr:hypothetical protein [Corynebacterium flavescens]